MTDKPRLWEILVPCNWNDGKPVRTRHHREWDRRVRAITAGLTVLKPGHGQWVDDGQVYFDRMIPVRLLATREQIERVADITIQHYEQVAVMFHVVSDECVIRYATTEQEQKFVRQRERSDEVREQSSASG